MGDTIMVRSFAPLPRLEDITFLLPQNRAFVTGESAMVPTYSRWVGTLFFIIAGLFILSAIGLTLAFSYPEQILGHPLPNSGPWVHFLGLPVALLGIADIGLAIYYRKKAIEEEQLAASGGLISGTVIRAKLNASKNGTNFRVECRFTSPAGKEISRAKGVGRVTRQPKTAPPAGSKVLILYDSDRLWQVL